MPLSDPSGEAFAPHRAVIRAYVDTHHDRARRAPDPSPTRLGLRYPGRYLADLIGPALAAVGLHYVEDDDFRRLFVVRSGRQVNRAWIAGLLKEALVTHPDAVLRGSVEARSFLDQLSDRLPYFEGEPEAIIRTTRVSSAAALPESLARRARRAREHAEEVETARRFLDEVRDGLLGTRVVRQDLHMRAIEWFGDRHGAPLDGLDGHRWRLPTARTLYRAADRILGAPRRHRRGFVYVVEPLDRPVLHAAIRSVQALRLAGDSDPDASTDATDALIGEPGPAPEPGPAVEVAYALPAAVASAIALADASGESPRTALARVGTFWADFRSDTRPAIGEAARLFSKGHGDAVTYAARYRVAAELAAEREALGA